VGPPNLAAHRSAAGGQPRPRRLRRGQPACSAAGAFPLCDRRRCATAPTRAPLGFKPPNREEEDAPSSFLLSRVHCPCSLPPFASLAGAKSYLAISASESSRSLSPPPRASLQPTHHHRPRLRFPKPQISAAAITRGRLAAKLTVGELGPTRSSPLHLTGARQNLHRRVRTESPVSPFAGALRPSLASGEAGPKATGRPLPRVGGRRRGAALLRRTPPLSFFFRIH